MRLLLLRLFLITFFIIGFYAVSIAFPDSLKHRRVVDDYISFYAGAFHQGYSSNETAYYSNGEAVSYTFNIFWLFEVTLDGMLTTQFNSSFDNTLKGGVAGMRFFDRIDDDRSVQMDLSYFYGKQQTVWSLDTSGYWVWKDSVLASKSVFSFNPWFVYNYKYFGFGSGFHVGNLELEPATNEDGFVWWSTEVRLQAMLRLGTQKIFFADAGVNEDHLGLGPSVVRYGIGSGFGTEFLTISTGFFKGNYERGMYFKGAFHLGESLLLEPHAALAGDDGVFHPDLWNLGIRVHYKFRHGFSSY